MTETIKGPYTDAMTTNRSIAFFDSQFEKQVAAGDFALNPFEQAALPYVRGNVLDLGCGLGNLCIAAARRGAEVIAVDGSSHAIERIWRTTMEEGLGILAVLADVARYEIEGEFDTIVAIGLLMFFKRDEALHLLQKIQAHVAPGGTAIVNVLTEGTTFMDMFEAESYYLFGRNELEASFQGWNILRSLHEGFDAPGGTRKEFATVIAQKR